MTKRFIDAHLHLTDSRIAPEAGTLIKQAEGDGVRQLFANTAEEREWQPLLTLANQHPAVRPFIGIHPWQAGEVTSGWQERLADALKASTAGVGEIGLDRFCQVPISQQEEIFLAQLEAARYYHRPVSIHCVKRWGRLIELLAPFKDATLPLLIHSFSGPVEIMHRLLDLGATISFSTQLAAPEREGIRQAFRAVPPERTLLETDTPDHFCPALTGLTDEAPQLNHPRHVAALYGFAAKLLGVDLDQFSQTIWENGQIFTH